MSIEETYKKYTQLEHVLARPGMYIGAIETTTGLNWVNDTENNTIIEKEVTWNPGLYKIFDEIVTNAADETQRTPKIKNISVNITNDTISVLNDGKGIPVEIHKEYNIYVPELIFGNLLSSSNYDDTKKRTVGGTNGIGAKLTNIYSTEFVLETCSNGKLYTQKFTDNMKTIHPPIIKETKAKEYTKITFKPDFKRFGIKDISQDDNLAILKKRVYDISAVTHKGVSVFFNDTKVNVKDFQDYMNLYLGGDKKEFPRVYEEVNSRWKVGVGLSKSGSFQQISFVNGIFTMDGGSHIDHILYPISKQISEELQAKHKNVNIKQNYIREHLFVFVWCLIDNPTFSSQTKDKNTTKISEFGSRCVISEDYIKKILKLGFVDQLLQIAETKDRKLLTKTDGKKTTKVIVPKLDDANKAGTYESDKCTLILTEGDSAKSTAISGLSIVGRNYYGVFPLKGKLLNTRTATYAQLSKNEEINNIKKILGLQTGKKYRNLKELRYGKILVMTDQDVDGYHIKSLIINFLYHGWPELLDKNIFVESLLTPVIKATNKSNVVSFYNIPDYELWRKSHNSKAWNIKYYKGLGTSTAKEAKEYFKDMKKLSYIVNNKEDSESLELAFDKTRADDRKKWITNATEKFESLIYQNSTIPVKNLIDQELVLFSIQDNIRSIPNLVDGFKPSQRKVLFACFKKKLTTEIKVAQLAGYVSEKTAYHHGENSLMQTIINMAQDFVGSNNMNLLQPNGQFGTRLMGGSDASSPRYIFTLLSKNSNYLFNSDDFDIIDHLEEDGQQIEPKFFVPTLPVILINGAQGIGTGFSTNVPCFNPLDLKKALRILAENPNAEIPELTPWYKNFKGDISKIDTNKWICEGKFEISKTENNLIIITELPVGTWTEDYKQFLEKLEEEDKIVFFRNNSTETSVNFEVKLKPDFPNDLQKFLKLTTNINAQNMNLFDENGVIVKMNSAEEILWRFFTIRSEYFQKRKNYLLKKYNLELNILKSKYEFIRQIIENELLVFRRKKNQIIEDITSNKFPFYKGNNYEYLLELNVYNFTEEKLVQLEENVKSKEEQIGALETKSIKDFWFEAIGEK